MLIVYPGLLLFTAGLCTELTWRAPPSTSSPTGKWFSSSSANKVGKRVAYHPHHYRGYHHRNFFFNWITIIVIIHSGSCGAVQTKSVPHKSSFPGKRFAACLIPWFMASGSCRALPDWYTHKINKSFLEYKRLSLHRTKAKGWGLCQDRLKNRGPSPWKANKRISRGGDEVEKQDGERTEGAITHQRSQRGIDYKHAGHELARKHHRLAGGHQEVQGCCQEQLELKLCHNFCKYLPQLICLSPSSFGGYERSPAPFGSLCLTLEDHRVVTGWHWLR